MQHNSLVYFPEIEINSNNILNISSTQVSVQKYQNAGTHTHTHRNGTMISRRQLFQKVVNNCPNVLYL